MREYYIILKELLVWNRSQVSVYSYISGAMVDIIYRAYGPQLGCQEEQ